MKGCLGNHLSIGGVMLCMAVTAGLFLAEPVPPGSTDFPVTTQRLRDARLEYHRSDPRLIWEFRQESFLLTIGGKTVPHDLIEKLTGQRTPVGRIAGTWKLNEQEGILKLSLQRVDRKAVSGESQLPISPRGLIRVQLGDFQYNVSASDPQSKTSQPELSFQQQGQDLVITMEKEEVDAPHVLWTHTEPIFSHDPHLQGPRRPPELAWVELRYHVIQCRDDPALQFTPHRKQKIQVLWRIPNHQKAQVPYRVIPAFRPSAAELNALAPKLKKLAEQSRQRLADFVP